MTERGRDRWFRLEVSRRDLRVFGTVMTTGMGGFGVVMALRGEVLEGSFLGLGAVLFLLVSLVPPLSLRFPYALWMQLARILGWINLHVLLAVIFYGLFTFLGICLRVMGRDPLERRWKAHGSSYWQPRSVPGDPRQRFERQF